MNSCNITVPKNGKYLTSQDFITWQDFFTELVRDNNSINMCGSYDQRVITITFVVTERCNLACTYCYESHYSHKYGKIMTKEIGEKVIDFLFDKKKINNYWTDRVEGVVLEFIGGEPLLEIELIDYMVDYFKVKAFELDHPWATNYKISMTSNGILYSSEKVQKFLKKNPDRVSLTITIDGNKDLHDSCRLFPNGRGSYDIVRKNVDKWVKETCAPQTKLTIAPENIIYLSESVKHLWDIGIININANPVYEDVWKIEHARIYYKQLKEIADYIINNEKYLTNHLSIFEENIGGPLVDDKNYCGGNGYMLAIGPDGRCYPCLRYMEHSMSTKREPFVIGDIFNGLESKETNKHLKELCSITMSSQSPQKCLECKIPSGCGLCVAYQYDVFGNPNKRATNICDMHKARVLANTYYWNKLYKKVREDKHFDLNLPDELALEIVSEEELAMLKCL